MCQNKSRLVLAQVAVGNKTIRAFQHLCNACWSDNPTSPQYFIWHVHFANDTFVHTLQLDVICIRRVAHNMFDMTFFCFRFHPNVIFHNLFNCKFFLWFTMMPRRLPVIVELIHMIHCADVWNFKIPAARTASCYPEYSSSIVPSLNIAIIPIQPFDLIYRWQLLEQCWGCMQAFHYRCHSWGGPSSCTAETCTTRTRWAQSWESLDPLFGKRGMGLAIQDFLLDFTVYLSVFDPCRKQMVSWWIRMSLVCQLSCLECISWFCCSYHFSFGQISFSLIPGRTRVHVGHPYLCKAHSSHTVAVRPRSSATETRHRLSWPHIFLFLMKWLASLHVIHNLCWWFEFLCFEWCGPHTLHYYQLYADKSGQSCAQHRSTPQCCITPWVFFPLKVSTEGFNAMYWAWLFQNQ